MPVWWPNQTPGKHLSQDLQSANAALIASAPDLLDACQLALEKLETTGEYPGIATQLLQRTQQSGCAVKAQEIIIEYAHCIKWTPGQIGPFSVLCL